MPTDLDLHCGKEVKIKTRLFALLNWTVSLSQHLCLRSSATQYATWSAFQSEPVNQKYLKGNLKFNESSLFSRGKEHSNGGFSICFFPEFWEDSVQCCVRFLVILCSWITLVFDSRSNGTSLGQLKGVSIFVIALALVGKVFDKRQQLPCCIAQCARLTVSANHFCLFKDKQSKSPVRFRSLASYEKRIHSFHKDSHCVCIFLFRSNNSKRQMAKPYWNSEQTPV